MVSVFNTYERAPSLNLPSLHLFRLRGGICCSHCIGAPLAPARWGRASGDCEMELDSNPPMASVMASQEGGFEGWMERIMSPSIEPGFDDAESEDMAHD